MKESLQQRIAAAVREEIAIAPYDRSWPGLFQQEADWLRRRFSPELLGRIEHFGSTAVPGLAAKPVIDMLIEVASLDEARRRVVPVLATEGYEYFWRTDCQPPYAWLIKRDRRGRRSHHLHLVESDSQLWDRLYFRDYLRRFPGEAYRYQELKLALARRHRRNREAYTAAKTGYINRITRKAERYFNAPA